MAILVALVFASGVRGADAQDRLIVACARPCASVASAVATLGGQVTQRYDNVDAIAVTLPTGRSLQLSAAVGADRVRKDVVVGRPPVDATAVPSVAAAALTAASLPAAVHALPANYNYNNNLTGATALHADGEFGQNTVVAVIDSGVQNVAPAIAGSVIGGENLVPAVQDPVTSATSRLNDWHGTTVSAMIAAHTAFVFLATSSLVQSLLANSPESVIVCPNAAVPGCLAGQAVVPMIGTAPLAQVYAIKVFPSQGGGAPESRIIAGMDRAITLRRNFNNGMPATPVAGDGSENNPFQYNALNIKVVNMSLGGPTLFAGRDIEDQLTTAMLQVGITLATSAGNDGFAAMTGGSPGTGYGSLTVGASSTPVHERVLRDVQFGVGIGPLYRPFGEVQTAYFSSRGPVADGRLDPDLSANGFASYANAYAAVSAMGELVSCGSPAAAPGTCQSQILFVSGTSFSSPTVAGAAALLRHAVPTATAVQTRNALIQSANPHIVRDGSTRIDQGNGFVDIPAARTLLASGLVSNELPHLSRVDRDDPSDEVGAGGISVAANLRKAGFAPVRFSHDRFTATVRTLKPGEVSQFFVPSDIFTDRLTVTVKNVVPSGAENVLFGDDIFLNVVDAPTSTAVVRVSDFVKADKTFVVDNPQTGLVRVALMGDWTNASRVSAQVVIERHRQLPTLPSAVGLVRQDDVLTYTVNVPAGKANAVFELAWLQNWGRYPTNDLDMLVIDPAGTVIVDADGNPPGATLNSPERVEVAAPAAGAWTVVVSGFTVQSHANRPAQENGDLFTLTATADGRRLKIAR